MKRVVVDEDYYSIINISDGLPRCRTNSQLPTPNSQLQQQLSYLSHHKESQLFPEPFLFVYWPSLGDWELGLRCVAKS